MIEDKVKNEITENYYSSPFVRKIYELETMRLDCIRYIKSNACYDEKHKKCKCGFSSMNLDYLLEKLEEQQ